MLRARDNPFSTDRVLGVRYRLQGVTWGELMGRLEGMNCRAALVGPDGSGKTTLLEDLASRLAARGYTIRSLRLDLTKFHFTAEELARSFESANERTILLLDGADHFAWWRWRWFRLRCRSLGGLIITSHRTGLLPTLLDCTTTPELLKELVNQLIGDAVWGIDCEGLFIRHSGNLRNALRELYDRYADGAGQGAG